MDIRLLVLPKIAAALRSDLEHYFGMSLGAGCVTEDGIVSRTKILLNVQVGSLQG